MGKTDSLQITHPKLCEEWDYEKNGDLTPDGVTHGSNKKVWWTCKKCGHKWPAVIASRTRGNGCPSCAGSIATINNCLTTLFPEIAKEWHPIKNVGLLPQNFAPYSHKIVWWLCKDCKHEWKSIISNRTNLNSGCPACSNQVVTEKNCLANNLPEIAKEWHPTKNGNLTPFDFTYGSGKKVWWICKNCGHEWKIQICNRATSNCPACGGRVATINNCLATNFPEIAAEWHPTKNGSLTPFDFTYGSGKKAWWLCKKENCKHEWEIQICDRTRGHGCPGCSGHALTKNNCLANNFPEIAAEWHPTKNNGLIPYNVSKGSRKKVWWLCKNCNNEWDTTINHRTQGNNCPKCSHSSISKTGSAWLDIEGVPDTKENREVRIYISKKKFYKVDGYIPETKTVYEYLGKFFHGCPKKYNPNEIHPVIGKTYGELYQKTLDRIAALRAAGYTVIYIWGD